MRCAACNRPNEPGRTVCTGCGAVLAEAARRRMEFLNAVMTEARSWPTRGVIGGFSTDSILKTLRGEHAELAAGLRELEAGSAPQPQPQPPPTTATPAIPVAKLVQPPAPQTEVPGSEFLVPGSQQETGERRPQTPTTAPAPAAPAPKPSAPVVATPTTPPPQVAAPAVATPQPGTRNEPLDVARGPEPAEGEPGTAVPPKGPPWYIQERNLRWLASLGILIFNVGLIGFITTSWGGWSPATKVSALAIYTALLLAGGLALRMFTRMSITGIALLALAVLSIPIEFYTVHYYRMTGLSAGALGSLGAAACLAVTLAVGALTRESFFFWISYLADVALACFLLELSDLRREAWTGPLIGLFGAYLGIEYFRRRLAVDPESRFGKLLAPARIVSIVGAAAALFIHWLLWAATERLSAVRDPALVILPLALGLLYSFAVAALERSPTALALAAALKLAILAAALRAADVSAEHWPPWFMGLGVLMVALTALLWDRRERWQLWPHCAAGWAVGVLAALFAAGFYLAELVGLGHLSGTLDAFIVTLGLPLGAAALFALFSGRVLPAALAAGLGLLETALIMARQHAEWRTVPLVFLGLATVYCAFAWLSGRAGRRGPGLTWGISSDVTAAAGLLCLLGAAPMFWETGQAPWATAFLIGAAALYAVEALLARPGTAYVAMAALFGAVPFAARSFGLEWPVAGAWLAGAALALPIALRRVPLFARPALIVGHVAAAVSLIMAICVYGLRDDLSAWALAAVACAAALHLWTAGAHRLPALEYTGLGIAAAAYLLLFREFHLAGHCYCLVAAAIPVAFYALSFLAHRLGWRAFVASAFDLALPATGMALVFVVAESLEKPHLWFAVATTAVLAAVYLLLAFVEAPRKWLAPAAAASLGSLLLAVTDVLLLIKLDAEWHAVPAALLALAAVCYALGWLANRAGRPGPKLAFTVFSDLAAAAGLLCLLGAAPKFWAPDQAPWAASFLLGAAALYAVEALLARQDTAYVAMAGLFGAVPFAARSLGLEWPVAGAWLAGAALVVPLLLRRVPLFARPALGVGHVAAAASLIMAFCVYGLREDLTAWALAAIACVAALHLWTAVASEHLELEYTGLALAAAAWLLLFREFHMGTEKYCLAAAAIPVAFYALSFLAHRLSWRAFPASAFDLAAPAAATALVFAGAWSLDKPHLWFAIATTAVLAAVYLALAFVEAPRKWLKPAAAAFVGSALLAASYLLVLHKYSTGTPYRSLWIFAIAPVLAAFGLWLRRAEKLKPQGASAIAVSVIVSLLALWQALVFPDKPLVATLAFAAAAALYAVLAAMLSSAVFGTFASAAFSVAYFSLLRHLHVPDHNYVLWLVALAMLQALVGGAGEERARERRPAMFVGLAVTVAVISWMIARGELYFDRAGPGLDSAIFTTIGSAAVFALVAWLRRTPVALYPAAAALLGSYYLVLHKYDVTAVEFYTVPVAALGLLWEKLVIRRRWGPGLWPTLAAAAALALALGPSLVLSLDSKELGHALAALCLGTVAVGAGMAMRRKVYLALGTGAFAVEGVIKLYHFVHRLNVGHWIWLILVGLAIIGFVVYAETRRNKRLREAADETVKKVSRMFDDWE